VPQGALHQAREKVREVAQAKDTEIAELKGQIAQLTAMFQQQPRTPPPAPQPPAPPPDRFSEPEAYDEWLKGQIVKPIEDRMASQNDFMSRRLAEMEHKPETVNAALMAMKAAYDSGEAHAEYQRIMASQHPYGELVTWHKNRTALTEIGNDPDAYRERVKAEIMAELQNGGQPPAPAGNPPPAQPVMPSNLASARNVGTRSGPTWGGPTALKDIFKR
jgi:hypothetical protein